MKTSSDNLMTINLVLDSCGSQSYHSKDGKPPAQVRYCSQTLQLFETDYLSRFNQHVLIDTTPLPDDIPKVPEIGASSAPLLSASFFIGARCKPYNDDYMMCKTDANGTGELDCLKEGRKVTRCAASVYVQSPIP